MDKRYTIRVNTHHELLIDTNSQWDGRLDDYLRRQLIPDSPHIAWREERFAEDSSGRGRIRIPSPNYPPPPQLRINELYWPTGAGRWAEGWFLVDGVSASGIGGELGSDRTLSAEGIRAAIIADDGSEDSIDEFNMYVLELREFTSFGDSDPAAAELAADEKSGWLVHLVDLRYFWQFQTVDFSSIDDQTTWNQLYTLLQAAMGLTIDVETIDSAYLKPDYKSLQGKHLNVSVALDAIAHSVGQRIVLDYSADSTFNQVRAVNDDASYADNTNTDGIWNLDMAMLGRNLRAPTMPKSVTVSFRRANNKIPACEGETHDIEVQASSTPDGGKYPYTNYSATHHVYSTQWATFSTAQATTPSNETALQALADKIAEDYYDKFTNRIDQSTSGIVQWQQSANDDFCVFSFGSSSRNKPYVENRKSDDMPFLVNRHELVMSTRVCSTAPNFGTRFQLSNDAEILDVGPGDPLIGKTTSAIGAATATAPGTGTVDVYDLDSSGNYKTPPIVSGLEVLNTTGASVATDLMGVQLIMRRDCKIQLVVEPCDNPPTPT